jgi:putative peptidoglycan lipid II flippase
VGYVFARLLAYQFGTSAQKDAFDIAYAVPFIVLNLSGFAYIHSVVTTHFVRLSTEDSPHIDAAFSTTLAWMTGLGGVLLVVTAAFSGPVTDLLAPGLSAAARAETRQLLLLMLPLALTLGVGTFVGAVLTAFRIPVTGEFCQLASRVGVVLFVICTGFRIELPSIAVGLVIASSCGLAIQWWILYRYTKVRFRWKLDTGNSAFRSIVKQGSGFLICAILAQFSIAYMRRVATLDGVGTNSALTFALAVVTPLSLMIGKPIALVIGPTYARLAAEKQWHAARRILIQAGAACLMLAIPMCLLLSAYSETVVYFLFGGGAFDQASTKLTASLSAWIVWALPAALLLWIVVMPALTTRNSNLPGPILALGHLTQIILTVLLYESYGRYGIAVAYVIAINLQSVMGIAFLAHEWRSAVRATAQYLPSSATKLPAIDRPQMLPTQ